MKNKEYVLEKIAKFSNESLIKALENRYKRLEALKEAGGDTFPLIVRTGFQVDRMPELVKLFNAGDSRVTDILAKRSHIYLDPTIIPKSENLLRQYGTPENLQASKEFGTTAIGNAEKNTKKNKIDKSLLATLIAGLGIGTGVTIYNQNN